MTACYFLERRHRTFAPIIIKFHVCVPLTGTGRKARYRAAEYSDLRNSCNKSALGAGKELRVVRVKSLTRRRHKFRLAVDKFHTAVVCGTPIRRSILIGLLKAYPCVGTVARPEDCIEVRHRDELKISRGPMRLLRASPPTKMHAVLRFTMCLR